MFSISPEERIPKLSEVHHFWALDPEGRKAVEYLGSLPKINPSLDNTRLEEIQAPPCGPVENINPDNAPADRFTDGGNESLLDYNFPLSSNVSGLRESSGLPTNFVANICLNVCFTESWKDADLTQAITGLDYLSNLECTRKTALREVSKRLRITEDDWQVKLAAHPEARDWVASIQHQEDQIKSCYSTLWLDLRIWTMLKELQSEPFYKPNVIAKLNTLFPVVANDLPSLRITASMMRNHRDTFYRYVVAVESDGKGVLSSFIDKLDRLGTGHTWFDTRQKIRDYISLADSMIKQASQVYSLAFFKFRSVENQSLQTPRFSGTPSSHSDRASSQSRKTQMSHDSSQLIRTNASGDGPNAENSSSLRSSLNSNNSPSSPDSSFSPLSRAKFSGRCSGHTFPSLGNGKKLFQESSQAPRYINTPYQSSPSVTSLETPHNAERVPVVSYSRPLTPSVDRPRSHGRSSSANRMISYEFRNTLPGTPELPGLQAVDKRIVSKSSLVSRTTASSESEVIIQDNETQQGEKKKKRLGLTLFRKKKNSESPPEAKPTIVLHEEKRSHNVAPARENFDRLSPPNARLFVPQEQVKKKSSFRFLQRKKSHENSTTLSDSTSVRTVTPLPTRIKPKRSLTNMFGNKVETTDGLGIDVNEKGRLGSNTLATASGLRQTIRKIRSRGSVRTASSVYSNDGSKNTPALGTPSTFGEDKVITSSDIDEPFPFRNFTPRQTPPEFFESREEKKDNETVRNMMIEKAREERMAKLQQSEQFKRKMEASRLKRRALREEMEASEHLSKLAAQRQMTQEEKRNLKQAAANSDPKIANSVAQVSGKPPKTPLKERLIKELASSYSPKSP